MQKYTKEYVLAIIGLIISFSGYTLKDFIQNDYIMTNPFTYQSVLTSLLVAVCTLFYFKIKDLSQKLETQNTDLSKKLQSQNTELAWLKAHVELAAYSTEDIKEWKENFELKNHKKSL